MCSSFWKGLLCQWRAWVPGYFQAYVLGKVHSRCFNSFQFFLAFKFSINSFWEMLIMRCHPHQRILIMWQRDVATRPTVCQVQRRHRRFTSIFLDLIDTNLQSRTPLTNKTQRRLNSASPNSPFDVLVFQPTGIEIKPPGPILPMFHPTLDLSGFNVCLI